MHTVACTCGQTIVSAEGPQRLTAGSKYGPGLGAWLIVHKCLLSMPVYRVEKLLRGHGIPISRSTLNELLHRAADKLDPIYDVLVRQVRAADVVLADETPLKLMSHDKQGYIWVFLGGTQGTLVTDAYAGYKPLTAKGGRVSAACLAHLRRKFHESLPTAPEAQTALDFILQVYRVEHEALAAGLAGTDAHLRLRQKRAGPAMGHLKKWMRQQAKVTAPKSPLGRAIAHALAQWKGAVRYLYDANVPVDNNASERALRVVALGHKNFYGAGSKDGGRVLAILYSLVTTCETANVNPFAYLRDVLVRVQTEDPQTLTPAAWAQAHG